MADGAEPAVRAEADAEPVGQLLAVVEPARREQGLHETGIRSAELVVVEVPIPAEEVLDGGDHAEIADDPKAQDVEAVPLALVER